MRLLLIKPSSFGDVLHALPAVEYMHRQISDLSLDWVVNDSFMAVARLSPHVRRLIPFPRRHFLSGAWEFRRQLRAMEYDVVLDLQGLLRSALIARFARAHRRIGFAAAREGASMFYSEKYEVEQKQHAIGKNLELIQKAFHLSSMELGRIPLQLDESAREEARELVSESEYMAVCFSSRWPSKNWPLSFLAKTLRVVQSKRPEMGIILIGSSEDRKDGERLASMVPGAQNLAGKTSFPGLAALLSRAKVMFTVDSGPMHLAAAVGTRCVSMFGATDSKLTGPWGTEGFHSVIHSHCAYSPCFLRRCPCQYECSAGISPERTAEILLGSEGDL